MPDGLSEEGRRARALALSRSRYTRAPDGSPDRMWIGRRSPTKSTWPGLLDHLVAGQQPSGITPMANVLKEAEEEAGVPAHLAARAVATGAISYLGLDEEGRLKNDVCFTFDLPLPADFTPTSLDGETENFELWDLDRVAAAVANVGGDGTLFKPNCNLVVIDFLARHGWLAPDEPGRAELIDSLRQGDCETR